MARELPARLSLALRDTGASVEVYGAMAEILAALLAESTSLEDARDRAAVARLRYPYRGRNWTLFDSAFWLLDSVIVEKQVEDLEERIDRESRSVTIGHGRCGRPRKREEP